MLEICRRGAFSEDVVASCAILQMYHVLTSRRPINESSGSRNGRLISSFFSVPGINSQTPPLSTGSAQLPADMQFFSTLSLLSMIVGRYTAAIPLNVTTSTVTVPNSVPAIGPDLSPALSKIGSNDGKTESNAKDIFPIARGRLTTASRTATPCYVRASREYCK